MKSSNENYYCPMLSLLCLLTPGQVDLFEWFKIWFFHFLERIPQVELKHFSISIQELAIAPSSLLIFSEVLFIMILMNLALLQLFHSPIGTWPFHSQISLHGISTNRFPHLFSISYPPILSTLILTHLFAASFLALLFLIAQCEIWDRLLFILFLLHST